MVESRSRYRRDIGPPPERPFKLPDEAIPVAHSLEAQAYCKSRGLSLLEIEHYNLHYAPIGAFAGRLIIPMYDAEGLVCYQGRVIDPGYTGSDRYRTVGPRPLYQPDPITESRVCIVEGPFDVFAVQRVMPCIATLGIGLSQNQSRSALEMIQKHNVQELYIWYDREAIAEAIRLQILLQPFVRTTVIHYTEAKDPGAMLKEEVARVIQSY